MSRVLRRFELLLPLRFNDGRAVPDEMLADTLLELESRFGAVSCETQTIRGLWQHEGQGFRDDLVRDKPLRHLRWNAFRTNQTMSDVRSASRKASILEITVASIWLGSSPSRSKGIHRVLTQ